LPALRSNSRLSEDHVDLTEIPLLLMLLGLAAYAVLGGADFGAGAWQLAGGQSDRDREIREHAHHAMGPVWETNHVWLVFVLVVCWTAYPTAFGSITSTLAVPLFIAGIGIILRGTAYALRSGTATAREQRRVEVAVAVSSILTPFALGAVIGGIASFRVPVGNAEGDLVSSWLNPTSILIGILAVATAAYLAAVYLAADAVRIGRSDLAAAFRLRALVSAVASGAVAIGGLAVLRQDARPLWDGLTSGSGVAAVTVSSVAGAATLWLVWHNRFEPARLSASVAVAAIIAGWALAQRPTFLKGLTIEQAAAGRSSLIAVIVSVALGAVLLVPSLGLLYGLVLKGRFDAPSVEIATETGQAPNIRPEVALVAAASLAIGGVFMFFFDSGWAHAVGAVCLFVFLAAGFVALAAMAAEARD
jgi:cytochrome d ubiquinol oxidase subunit II